MRLPGAEQAFVDLEKLRDYCLSPTHPRGRHKARVFASALLILQQDVKFLQERLLEAARNGEADEGEADKHGVRYIVDFECIRGDRRATIRSGWTVRRGENFPRLSTCYVLSK